MLKAFISVISEHKELIILILPKQLLDLLCLFGNSLIGLSLPRVSERNLACPQQLWPIDQSVYHDPFRD